jgi:hypothetical protein
MPAEAAAKMICFFLILVLLVCVQDRGGAPNAALRMKLLL